MNIASLKKIEVSDACPICLEDMNEARKVVITKCTHAFHEECITFHLNINKSTRARASCPCCRQMPIPMVRAEGLPNNLETSPYIECRMLRALRDGDVDYVYAALLAQPHLIEELYESKKNNVKYHLLTLAVMFEHTDLVVSLLGKVKKESIDEFSSDGFNALSVACIFGHTQIAELLLNAGADANNLNADGKNALWFAACAGKKDTVELLVRFGSRVVNKSTENVTALFMAAQKGHLEVVNYLINVIPKEELKEHINICSSSTATPATALYMAAQGGHSDIVSSLLLAGADPNQPIDFGQIPLHVAASSGHLEVVKILVTKGTDVNYQAPDNSATALGYAAAKGHKEICEYLLKANADPALGYEDHFFKRQVSAAELARENGHFELANYLENYSH